MDKDKLEQLKQKLYSATFLIGGWQRHKAASELAAAVSNQDLEATTLFVEALSRSSDPQVKTLALESLKKVTDQRCIDAICTDWASSRHQDLTQLINSAGWVASTPAKVRVLTALKNKKLEIISKGGADICEALLDASKDSDAELSRQAREGLNSLQNADAIDTLCARWLKERDNQLGQLVVQKGYVARQPAEAQILSALKVGKTDIVVKGGANVVEILVKACSDADTDIAKQAQTSLRQLKNEEAQQALCRLATEREDKIIREAVIAANYAPKDQNDRLLFYLFTDQWDKYELLDRDSRQLRAIYEKADGRLRERIEVRANARGYELTETVYGERKRHRLAEMTGTEWQVLLSTVESTKKRAEVLRLVQEAPPQWGMQVLLRMQKSGWTPRTDERTSYEELLKLAQACESSDPQLPGKSINTLEGHTDVINCLVISPDSRIVASGSQDNTIRLWSLADGKLLQTLDGHTGAITCLMITADSRYLISGSADQTVKIWSLPDGMLSKVLAGHTDEISCLAISPDGKTLASGSLDNSIRLWRLPSGEEIKELKEHAGSIWALAFSPDGNILASGGGLADHTVKLWAIPAGTVMQTLEGHKGLVRCLAFTPNGRMLVSGSGDNTLRIWQLSDGKELKLLKGHKGLVNSISISTDGRTLATSSVDKTVRLWSLPNGQELKKLDKHKDRITALISDIDGRALITSSWDSTIKIWSVTNRQELKTLEGHGNWVTCLTLSGDGQFLVSGSRDNTLRIWPVKSIMLAHLPARQTTVSDLAWAEKVLKTNSLPSRTYKELEFIAALMRWRNKLDLNKDNLKQIEIGEFDIELN